jgi:hypothetical protein
MYYELLAVIAAFCAVVAGVVAVFAYARADGGSYPLYVAQPLGEFRAVCMPGADARGADARGADARGAGAHALGEHPTVETGAIYSHNPHIAALFAVADGVEFRACRGEYLAIETRPGAFDSLRVGASVSTRNADAGCDCAYRLVLGYGMLLPILRSECPHREFSRSVPDVYEYLLESDMRLIPYSAYADVPCGPIIRRELDADGAKRKYRKIWEYGVHKGKW